MLLFTLQALTWNFDLLFENLTFIYSKMDFLSCIFFHLGFSEDVGMHAYRRSVLPPGFTLILFSACNYLRWYSLGKSTRICQRQESITELCSSYQWWFVERSTTRNLKIFSLTHCYNFLDSSLEFWVTLIRELWNIIFIFQILRCPVIFCEKKIVIAVLKHELKMYIYLWMSLKEFPKRRAQSCKNLLQHIFVQSLIFVVKIRIKLK